MNGALALVLVRFVSIDLISYGTLGSAMPQRRRLNRAGPLPSVSSVTDASISVSPARAATDWIT